MNLKSLDVVSLRDGVVGEFKKFATSTTRIFADDIWRQVEAIYTEWRTGPNPLIQINPSYQRSTRPNALGGRRGPSSRFGASLQGGAGPDPRSEPLAATASGTGDCPGCARRELRRDNGKLRFDVEVP